MTPALAPRRGDVALVLFPFTDLTGAKLRPAIVLASQAPHDIVLAFVTSREVLADDSATAVVSTGKTRNSGSRGSTGGRPSGWRASQR